MTPDLGALLTIWRETRDPALVPLVVRLGKKVAVGGTGAFHGLKPTALGEAITRSLQGAAPEKLDALLPVVERFVRTARGSWPVVELLAELPPDPRIATLALGLMEDFGDLPHVSAKLWRRLVDLVETHGDAAAGRSLLDLRTPENMGAAAGVRLANVARRLAGSTKPVPADELARLEGEVDGRLPATAVLVPHPAPPTKETGEALLAAVYADPDDDDARLVYADWLSTQGDPRGEFISLQFARAEGRLTRAAQRREGALLREHFHAWAAPLLPLLSEGRIGAPDREPPVEPDERAVPISHYRHVAFAKGFLSRLGPFGVPRHRRFVLEDPIWSTIRTLAYAPTFVPAMRSLRSVDGCFAEDVASLGLLPQRLEHVRVDGSGFHRRRPPRPGPACSVKRMTIEVHDEPAAVVSWLLWATASAPTLEAVRFERKHLAGWSTDKRWSAVDGLPPSLTSIRLEIGSGEALELRRTAGAWDTVFVWPGSTPQPVGQWRDVFRPFAPRPFASMVVFAPPGASALDRSRFGENVRAFAREVVVHPEGDPAWRPRE